MPRRIRCGPTVSSLPASRSACCRWRSATSCSERMHHFNVLLKASDPGEPSIVLTLAHDQRRRAKLRVALADGSSVGLALPRGLSLRDGDRLLAEASGLVARVRAAPEHVSVVETTDALLLARAAYHLGNRHVVLSVEP